VSNIILADEKVDLRRGVDHIGISASFVIHDGNGKILLHKRSKNCRDEHGAWDVGGGAIEFGESIEDAMRRELMEELCTEPVDMKFLTVYDAHREHNGAKTHWIAIIYAIAVDPSKVKIGEPHKIDEIAWFTSKNLPAPLHSQFTKSYTAAIKAGIVA
jgi:8-oxo-dGTP diphosphatase